MFHSVNPKLQPHAWPYISVEYTACKCLQQTDIHINLVTFTPSALAKPEHNTDRKEKPSWQK